MRRVRKWKVLDVLDENFWERTLRRFWRRVEMIGAREFGIKYSKERPTREFCISLNEDVNQGWIVILLDV